jgi:Short C-terminal domain
MPFFRSSEDKLVASGRGAKADILASAPTHHVVERGRTGIEQLEKRTWDLTVRVHAPDEPDFEVEFKQLLGSWRMPWRGESADVLYDPDDHAKTILDPRVDGPVPRPEWLWNPSTGTSLPKARRAAEQAERAPSEHRADMELLAKYYLDGALYDFEYQELRRRILGLPLVDPRPAIAAAVGAPGGQLSVRSAADGHEIPLGDAEPSATVPDLSDRLAKLEDLADRHDRGELTDAQFSAAKQQLMSGAP